LLRKIHLPPRGRLRKNVELKVVGFGE